MRLSFSCLSHVAENQIVKGDRLDGPGRVEDRVVGAHHEYALLVRVTFLDNCLVRQEGTPVSSRSGKVVMGCQQGVDISGKLHMGGDEHDEVVTDPFEVSYQMRGEDDAYPVLGDDLHESLEELASGKGVQTSYRLVEDENLRFLRESKDEGELGSLATGERPGLLAWVKAELFNAAFRKVAIPVWVEPGAHTKMLGN
jgi:hypothetical protein